MKSLEDPDFEKKELIEKFWDFNIFKHASQHVDKLMRSKAKSNSRKKKIPSTAHKKHKSLSHTDKLKHQNNLY